MNSDEIARLREDLRSQEQEADDLRTQVGELLELVEALTLDKDQLTLERDMAEQSAAADKADLDTVRGQLAAALQEKAAMAASLVAAQPPPEPVLQPSASTTSADGGPGGDVEALMQQNGRLRQALGKLRDMTTAEISELRAALEVASQGAARTGELERQNGGLVAQLAALKADLETVKETVDATNQHETMIERLTEENLDLGQRLEDALAAIASLEESKQIAEDTDGHHVALESQLRAEIATLNDTITRGEMERQALQGTLEDKTRMMGRYREAIERLKHDLTALQAAKATEGSDGPAPSSSAPSDAMVRSHTRRESVAMADAVASLTMQLDTLRTEVACMHGVAVGVVGAVAGARLRAAMLSSLLPTSVMEGSVDAVVATLDLLQSVCHAEAGLRAFMCKRLSLPADTVYDDFRLTNSLLGTSRTDTSSSTFTACLKETSMLSSLCRLARFLRQLRALLFSKMTSFEDFSTSVSSCRHSLTQLDGTLRAVTSHLSTYGAVPVDDASVLALLHHANAVKTLVLSLLASGAAPCVHTVDAFESAHAREASQFLCSSIALLDRGSGRATMSSHALADVAVAAGDSVDVLVVWSEVWTGLTVTAGVVHTLGLAHAHVLAELKAASQRSDTHPTVAALLALSDTALLTQQVLLSATERFRDSTGFSFDTLVAQLDGAFTEGFSAAAAAATSLEGLQPTTLLSTFAVPRVACTNRPTLGLGPASSIKDALGGLGESTQHCLGLLKRCWAQTSRVLGADAATSGAFASAMDPDVAALSQDVMGLVGRCAAALNSLSPVSGSSLSHAHAPAPHEARHSDAKESQRSHTAWFERCFRVQHVMSEATVIRQEFEKLKVTSSADAKALAEATRHVADSDISRQVLERRFLDASRRCSELEAEIAAVKARQSEAEAAGRKPGAAVASAGKDTDSGHAQSKPALVTDAVKGDVSSDASGGSASGGSGGGGSLDTVLHRALRSATKSASQWRHCAMSSGIATLGSLPPIITASHAVVSCSQGGGSGLPDLRRVAELRARADDLALKVAQARCSVQPFRVGAAAPVQAAVAQQVTAQRLLSQLVALEDQAATIAARRPFSHALSAH